MELQHSHRWHSCFWLGQPRYRCKSHAKIHHSLAPDVLSQVHAFSSVISPEDLWLSKHLECYLMSRKINWLNCTHMKPPTTVVLDLYGTQSLHLWQWLPTMKIKIPPETDTWSQLFQYTNGNIHNADFPDTNIYDAVATWCSSSWSRYHIYEFSPSMTFIDESKTDDHWWQQLWSSRIWIDQSYMQQVEQSSL